MKLYEEIRAKVEEKLEGCKVLVTENKKNNGVVLTGLVIKKEDEKISPCFYLNSMLEEELEVDEIVNKVVREYEDNIHDMPVMNADSILPKSKEDLLAKVVYKIVNKEKNMEMLQGVPHKDFLDLAYVYLVLIPMKDGSGAFTISHGMKDMYGVTQAELDKAAYENTKNVQNYKGMSLAEMLGIPTDIDNGMNVIRGNDNYGATAFAYPEYFAELAEKLDSDLMILPSSIHELLAIPADMISVEEAMEMVKGVNETEVAEEEILSYNVYKYSRETGLLEIA